MALQNNRSNLSARNIRNSPNTRIIRVFRLFGDSGLRQTNDVAIYDVDVVCLWLFWQSWHSQHVACYWYQHFCTRVDYNVLISISKPSVGP